MAPSRRLAPALITALLAACAVPAMAPTPLPPPIEPPPEPAPEASSSASEPLRPDLPAWWYRHTRDEPRNKGDLCEVANSNINAALDAVLSEKAPEATGARPAKKGSGRGFERLVETRFALGRREKTLLDKNGFVVPKRLSRPSYAHAYHDIYQSQLPVYVTLDSLFHAVFRVHEALMVQVERDMLSPRVERLVSALRAQLGKSGKGLPAEVARDLDVYLTVASSLLSQAAQKGVLGDVDGEVSPLLSQIEKAGSLAEVELFGRTRMVDFSQYMPRGHYALHEELAPYFKSVMWLSRLELNLVSRSSRSSALATRPTRARRPARRWWPPRSRGSSTRPA